MEHDLKESLNQVELNVFHTKPNKTRPGLIVKEGNNIHTQVHGFTIYFNTHQGFYT
jgi:hypothetical protein